MSGVKIGDGCIIGLGSIVTKDILPFSVVAGNPARVIKQYDFNIQKWTKNEMIKKNKKNVWQNMTS